jgi:Fibronectin type III domain/Beta-propeller repeat
MNAMRLKQLRAALAATAVTLMAALPAIPEGQGQSTPQVIRDDGGRYDRSGAIAVDAAGAFYIGGSVEIGSSRPTFAALKFNRDGSRSWRTNYSGSAGGSLGQAFAIAVDAQGSVYAAGYISVGFFSTETDALVVKFDANGVEQWARRYNGPGNGPDAASSIAVDHLGNAYVGGYSYGTGIDWVTLKYGPDGAVVWTRRHSGPGNFDDRVSAASLDPHGDLVVTGITKNRGDSVTNDVTTVKYSPDGGVVWTRTFSSTADTDDVVFDLAIDASGSLYLSGSVAPTADPEGPRHVPLALLYDTNGNLIRAVQGEVAGNGTAIAIDSIGDVYVATETSLLKYDRTLAPIRSVPLAASLHVAGLIADSRNNVLVAGTSFDPFTFVRDYYTAKLDRAGQTLWTHRFNGTGNRDDVVAGAAVDSDDALIVTGTSWGDYVSLGGTADDIVTLKFGASGGTPPPPAPQPPAAPSNLTAVAVSRSQIRLAWSDNSTNETGFSVERCAGGGCTSFAAIAKVAPGTTSFVNGGLSRRTTYRYRVRALGTAGKSPYSNVAAATTAR